MMISLPAFSYWALAGWQLSGLTGVYSAPILPAGYTGGSGQQLFSYSPLAPGTAAVTFAYGCVRARFPCPHAEWGRHIPTLYPAEARTPIISAMTLITLSQSARAAH